MARNFYEDMFIHRAGIAGLDIPDPACSELRDRFVLMLDQVTQHFFESVQSSRWIPVSERLPEITERWKDHGTEFECSTIVLVRFDDSDKAQDEDICLAQYFGAKSGWAKDSGESLDKLPSAWMSLDVVRSL